MSLAIGCGEDGASKDKRQEEPAWEFTPLSPEAGFSVEIPSFAVPAGHEDQSCYFIEAPDLNNDGKDYWVDKVEVSMNLGSHHMNVFRVRSIINLKPDEGETVQLGGGFTAKVQHGTDDYLNHPCWGSSNWADWPLVANTQEAVPDEPYVWQLPEGVAMRFTPGEKLMIQTHYVNTDVQPTPSGKGRVSIHFNRSSAESPMELGTLFATQQNLRVCKSHPESMFSGTCKFPGAVTITAANGHFHSRGEKFSMFTWDGKSTEHPKDDAEFYVSNEWDHPSMDVGIERKVESGGGLWWDCEFKWKPPQLFTCDDINEKDESGQDDCCYTFGGNTDIGEHCNVFMYYYPKVDDKDVFCN